MSDPESAEGQQPYLSTSFTKPGAETVPCSSLEPHLPLPRTVGRYELREMLGGGGMGTVYRAFDYGLEIEVALKAPHEKLLERNPAIRLLFLHEGRSAARLRNPNVCRIFDVGEIQGIPYISMELIHGRPLPRKKMELKAALELIHSLALTLADAHQQGVIHCDLKTDNVLLTPEYVPILTDFGLAIRLDAADAQLPSPEDIRGTPVFMAPEQVDPTRGPVDARTDVYSLGVMLYTLLTGELPLNDPNLVVLLELVLTEVPVAPSALNPELSSRLDAICLKAMEKPPEDRYQSMSEFAQAIAQEMQGPPPTPVTSSDPGPVLSSTDQLQFEMIGPGTSAPANLEGSDRLYLDVGNDLRPGVIDHHQQQGFSTSATSLVLHRPELILQTVNANRSADAPFTLVLHENPDLDSVCAVYLTWCYLSTGRFPREATSLAAYVDRVDEGSLGLSSTNPGSLYTAHRCLMEQIATQGWPSELACWQEQARQGAHLVGRFLNKVHTSQDSLPEVDAFDCSDLLTDNLRAHINKDQARYLAKLQSPNCFARSAELRLPGRFWGTVKGWLLTARDVQNVEDPERCAFFKDWARTDTIHCPNGTGFEILCIYHAENTEQKARAILSVTPASGASLRGLGAALEQAEVTKRRTVAGKDQRLYHPETEELLPHRPGYHNPDPWYDGRGHSYTIVDSPRGGTILNPEEIERILLQFGRASLADLKPIASRSF